MSVKAISWVWDHSQAKGLDRFVLVAIADCANDQGQQAYPSTASLAAKTGLSVRTVQRSVASLVALGELTCEPNAGRRGTNLYGLQMRPPSDSRPRQTVAPVRQSPNPRQADGRTVLEPSEEPTPPPVVPQAAAVERADVRRVCDALADAIEANGARRPTVTRRWLADARLMIDKDGRSEREILGAIRWATADSFWRANVLSMTALRRQYDRLRMQAQRPMSRGNDKLGPIERGLALVQGHALGSGPFPALPGGAR